MYTIKKVSEIVGIPTVTIRAWENRYNIITPQRSEGGHRLYSNEDISKLHWLKKQTHTNNLKISDAIRLLQSKTPSITLDREENHREIIGSKQNYGNTLDQLYNALIDLDSTQSNTIIDTAFALYDFEEVLHQVLVPVLFRIGDEWENGHISVAQEHFATELVMQRFSYFFRILPINSQYPKVLAFCPEGEIHQIGLLLFSLFLRRKSLEVIYLGPNTPYSDLTNLISQKNISVVAISLTNSHLAKDLHNWIIECQNKHHSLKIVLGGKGLKNLSVEPSSNIFLLEEIGWDNWLESELLNK